MMIITEIKYGLVDENQWKEIIAVMFPNGDMDNVRFEAKVYPDGDCTLDVWWLNNVNNISVFFEPDGDMNAIKNGWIFNITNQQKVMHLVFESQWIDQNVELPKEGQEVIIKFGRYIITAFYHQTGFESIAKGLPDNEIEGWLPADRVVM